MSTTPYIIHQFFDKALAHYAYAILSGAEVVLIDPGRNPQPYYDFALQHQATIVGVIETHPHADFVSSHLEIHEHTGATIYASKLLGADYPHSSFDDGQHIALGSIRLKALNTPGHSPDHIAVVLESDGKDRAVFSGDALFIGDCGRPDLREGAGNITGTREELARMMYHTLREKFMKLDDDVVVYPAHGAGSLCGKGLSDANSSTIGEEKQSNWSLQPMSEEAFIAELTTDQPFIPAYFGHDVALNKSGAPSFKASVAAVKTLQHVNGSGLPQPQTLVIDARPADQYKRAHYAHSFNIQDGGKFETWLGSIVKPGEAFYLLAADPEQLSTLLARTAKIGYETQVAAAITTGELPRANTPQLELSHFKQHPQEYTIVDVRNPGEVAARQIFKGAINIPLAELRERATQIPTDKPIVVHCAAGYRSAAGSSIIAERLPHATVYDLGEAISTF